MSRLYNQQSGSLTDPQLIRMPGNYFNYQRNIIF